MKERDSEKDSLCDPDDWLRQQSDDLNCGSCGFVCPPGTICVQGVCMPALEAHIFD